MMTPRDMDAIFRQRIGARVFAIRCELEMPALVLAERSGVHRNTIYRIEAGLSLCMVGQMWRIARVLGVDIGDLLRDSPSMIHRSAEVQKEA